MQDENCGGDCDVSTSLTLETWCAKFVAIASIFSVASQQVGFRLQGGPLLLVELGEVPVSLPYCWAPAAEGGWRVFHPA